MRIFFRADAKPFISTIYTYQESIVSFFAFDQENNQKCVQRYKEPNIELHSFDVENSEENEKSELEFEIFFKLSQKTFPSLLDGYEYTMKRDYSFCVKAICGDTDGPIVYHDIFISSRPPREKDRHHLPPITSNIKPHKTFFDEMKMELDGNDFF